MFGSSKIKQQHETKKNKNEEVMLKHAFKALINELNGPVHKWGFLRKCSLYYGIITLKKLKYFRAYTIKLHW